MHLLLWWHFTYVENYVINAQSLGSIFTCKLSKKTECHLQHLTIRYNWTEKVIHKQARLILLGVIALQMKLFSSLGQELYQLKALQNCLLSEMTSFMSSQVPVMAWLQWICWDISCSTTHSTFPMIFQKGCIKHKKHHETSTYTVDKRLEIEHNKRRLNCHNRK